MTPLSPEIVYLPFESGPYRMAMGLTAAREADWFELDTHYPTELSERRRLLAEHHGEVFATVPASDAARAETLAMVTAWLVATHPTWFHSDGETLHNKLAGEAWNLAAPPCDPLELAGRLVQEDLCIIQNATLTAAVLCFPSRWRLQEKIGRPLAEVHTPVPLYADRLARPVDRFMGAVRDGHIAQRLNWSVLDSPDLFQPTGKWREATNEAVTAVNAGTTLFLRVERQTLRKLPLSNAVLFGIRVHNYMLADAITTSETAARLASAVRALPHEILHYKSMLTIQDALLGWLNAQAGSW